MLCVDRNIPILGTTTDGNASDKTLNNELLTNISTYMADHGLQPGAYVYVADAAFVTEDNLDACQDQTWFLTRLPATYNECSRIVRQAVASDCWIDIGPLAEERDRPKRPVARYRAYDGVVELYGKTYIDYNPLRDAKRPRGKGNTEEKKIKILTPTQIKALLGGVEDQKYKTLIQLAVMSGARQGELLGLKWPDVDWENSQIYIQRSFNKGSFYSTKTQTSKRRIDLGPAMMTELKRWRLACPKNRLQLVFPNESGNPINYSNAVNRYFKPALEKAGLPSIRWHDLRHTFASLLIHQGENIKYIQSQLGHSSPTVTLNVYAHLMNPVNQASACRLENTIFSATGSKMVAVV